MFLNELFTEGSAFGRCKWNISRLRKERMAHFAAGDNR